jgi:hypothetical protein
MMQHGTVIPGGAAWVATHEPSGKVRVLMSASSALLLPTDASAAEPSTEDRYSEKLEFQYCKYLRIGKQPQVRLHLALWGFC